jgi:hypothetical protein
MTKAIKRDPIYRRRRFPAETIELCVRWYITYRLSYRDLIEMMAERGITVSHTTILRWVSRYVPEFEKRWARYARPVDFSWRVDETAVSVRGGKHYLYRAVDRHGKSVDHLLFADRSREAAWRFSAKRSRHMPTSGLAPSIWTATPRATWPATAARGGLEVAGCHGARPPVSEQHCRAGPSSDQTPLRLHAGIQVVQDRGDHARRHRTGAPYSQAAVLRSQRTSRQSLLALQLPLQRETEDACTGGLSLRLARNSKGSSSGRSASARCRHGPLAHEVGIAHQRGGRNRRVSRTPHAFRPYDRSRGQLSSKTRLSGLRTPAAELAGPSQPPFAPRPHGELRGSAPRTLVRHNVRSSPMPWSVPWWSFGSRSANAQPAPGHECARPSPPTAPVVPVALDRAR